MEEDEVEGVDFEEESEEDDEDDEAVVVAGVVLFEVERLSVR